MILQELVEPSQQFCIEAILRLVRLVRLVGRAHQGHVLGVSQDRRGFGDPKTVG